MNIIPLEEDVLSMEMFDSFYHSLTQEDLEFKSQAVEVVRRLEKVYGIIRHKFSKGHNATDVLEQLLKGHQQERIYRGEEPLFRPEKNIY